VSYAVLYPIVHRKGEEGTLKFDLLGTVRGTGAWGRLRDTTVDVVPHHVVPVFLVVVGHAPVLVVGLVALLAARRAQLDDAERLLAICAVVGAAIVLGVSDQDGGQLYFWDYAYVALAALAALGIEGLLSRPGGGSRVLAVAPMTVLAVLGAASTVFISGPHARRIVATIVPGVPGPFHTEQPSPAELTPSVLRGLRWLRDHSDDRAVVAVNNQASMYAPGSHHYFYYSAFSERQIMLEGFGFTPAFWLSPTPASLRELSRRLSLLDSIYREGSAAAIDEVRRRYGVDYLLEDRRNELPQHTLPASVARVVFSNAEIRIYSLATARSR
jgi:hypothetical protein